MFTINDQNVSQTNGKRDPKALSSDDFMKLFLTQLQTQSPLDPFDSSTMLDQMSQ